MSKSPGPKTSSSSSTPLLLGVFLGVLFVAANLMGFRLYGTLSARQQSEINGLKAEEADNASMISLRDVWMERDGVLNAYPVPTLDPSSAGAGFLQALQEGASARGVRVLDQSFGSPGRAQSFDTVTVRLKTAGTMEAVAKWLFDIQREGEYRAITEMTLRSDKEAPNVLCDVQIVQFFSSARPGP